MHTVRTAPIHMTLLATVPFDLFCLMCSTLPTVEPRIHGTTLGARFGTIIDQHLALEPHQLTLREIITTRHDRKTLGEGLEQAPREARLLALLEVRFQMVLVVLEIICPKRHPAPSCRPPTGHAGLVQMSSPCEAYHSVARQVDPPTRAQALLCDILGSLLRHTNPHRQSHQ